MFSEFIHGEEKTYFERYLEYCAHRDSVSLDEAAVRSLSRAYQHFNNSQSPLAIITAFRSERGLPENRSRNQSLTADLRALGWGFTPVLGGFVEQVRDVNGKETGEKRKVTEESFFVGGTGDAKTFENKVIELLKKYEQESAVIKPPSDLMAYLVGVDGSRIALGPWSVHKLSDFYTQMRKGPSNRAFAFEAAADLTISTRRAVDMFEKTKG